MNENNTPQNYNVVMTIFAYLAAVVTGIGTYDVSVHFSPAVVSFLFFDLPREFIGLLSVGVVDGLYILLDSLLAKFPTHNTRRVAIYIMVMMLIIMTSANLTSAIINNTIDTSSLGNFSWIIYGIKMGGLIYLGFYTYARWDDPLTKRKIIEIELSTTMDEQINHFEKKYGKAIGQYGGEMVALVGQLETFRAIFEEKTGKDVRTVLGPGWQRGLVKQMGVHVPAEFVFSDEPIDLDSTDPDRIDAGSSRKGKKKSAALNAGSPPTNPLPPSTDLVPEEKTNLLQTSLGALRGLAAKAIKSVNF